MTDTTDAAAQERDQLAMKQAQEILTYYKFLTKDGAATNTGHGWNLPSADSPGEWMPEIKDPLKICAVGYHAVDRDHVLEWIHDRLYVVELSGEVIHEQDKYAASNARLLKLEDRWNEWTTRLFAADCAAFAMKFAKRHDPRSLEAIKVVRLFAEGKATQEELRAAGAAAGAAAWNAAGATVWNAARAAAWAAAGNTAWDAARAAARNAAGAAAWAAARAAARNAAGAAAWNAAGAAAGTALTLRFWEYVEATETPEPWPIGFDAINHYREITE